MAKKKEDLKQVLQPKPNKLIEQIRAQPQTVGTPEQQATNRPTGAEGNNGQALAITNEQGVPVGFKSPQGDFIVGIRPEQARSMLDVYAKQRMIPGAAGAGEAGLQTTAQLAEVQSAEQLAAAQSQAVMGLNQNLPQRRDLNPPSLPGENIPFVGSNIAVMKRLWDEVPDSFSEDQAALVSPEAMKSAVLSKIEKNVIKKGLSRAEKDGALIEAVPIIGKFGRYVSSFTTPSGEVDDLKKGITKQKEYVTEMSEMVGQGLLDPAVALEQIDYAERDLQRMESKIKLLVAYSATLRAQPEEVNNIESEILIARTKISRARIKVAQGSATMQPNEYQMYSALRKLKKEY